MAQHGCAARFYEFYEANPAGDYWTFQWIDTALLGGPGPVVWIRSAERDCAFSPATPARSKRQALALGLTVITVLLPRHRV
ncbi:hypothetical protein [Streptomyces sp. NPDC058812]|uniref:hypothetical protein n=1 Tax=unclassified Streptomyces TaxID=2593676 RepID=UPI003684F83F